MQPDIYVCEYCGLFTDTALATLVNEPVCSCNTRRVEMARAKHKAEGQEQQPPLPDNISAVLDHYIDRLQHGDDPDYILVEAFASVAFRLPKEQWQHARELIEAFQQAKERRN